jgi:hypothetical protein
MPEEVAQNEEKATAPASSAELGQFASFAKTITSTMKEVASLADNGVSTALIGIGGAVLVLSLLLKLRPLGFQVSSLEPSEFIALLACGTILILCGAGLRLYQYQKDREVARVLTDTGAKIIESSAASSARIQEKALEAGVALTRPVPTAPQQQKIL